MTDAIGTVVRVNQATAPDHVRGAFGVSDGPAVPVVAGSGTGWFVEDAGSTGVVLRPVSDTGLANWSARVREQLDVTGLRVAQPLRSRDGRHVVSGWRADHALSGRPEARADETIAWSARLNEALAAVERPRIVRRPAARPWSGTDLFACAEAASWDGDPEVDLAPVSKKGLAHPARPGAGTVGKKVMIRANHFLVNVADNNLFHYDVS